MFIDTAHHYYRLRLEIDAFVGAASSRDSSSKSAHESTEIAAGSRSYGCGSDPIFAYLSQGMKYHPSSFVLCGKILT